MASRTPDWVVEKWHPRRSIRDLDEELSVDKDRLRLMIQQGAASPVFVSSTWITLESPRESSVAESLEVHRSKNGLKLTAGAQVAPYPAFELPCASGTPRSGMSNLISTGRLSGETGGKPWKGWTRMAKGFSRTAPEVLNPSPGTPETQPLEALQDSLRARKDLRTCVPSSRLNLSC